jgi:hypothetical protein
VNAAGGHPARRDDHCDERVVGVRLVQQIARGRHRRAAGSPITAGLGWSHCRVLGCSAKISPTAAAGMGNRSRVVLSVTDYTPCARHPSRRRSRPHHDTGCRSCRDGNADMTSVHNPDHVDAHSSPTPDCSARLSLKPSSSARGAVDGAWWPRSTDPAIELAALIEALGAQRTPVRGIALNRAGWDSAPRRIRLASGRKVAVDWFPTGDVRMIRIIDTDYQRIDLLVIPVDTTPAIAELAVTMVTEGQDPDITSTVGHHFGPVRPPAEAEAAPDNDDGASEHLLLTRSRATYPATPSAADASFSCHTGPAETDRSSTSSIGRNLGMTMGQRDQDPRPTTR